MPKNSFNFTKRSIEALAAPTKRTRFQDTGVRGLTLMVWPTGRKVFYWYRKVKGGPKELKIGPFPDLTIDQARTKAMEYNMAIANNEDPTAESRRAKEEWTFAQAADWWLENVAKDHKSHDLYRWIIKHRLQGLVHRRLSQITKAELRQLHSELGDRHGKPMANKVFEVVRAVFNTLVRYDLFSGPNPMLAFELFKLKSRERRLMPAEIPAFLKALDEEINKDLADYVWLSLLTGARQGNVLAMRWDQIDDVGKFWHIPETKNGEPVTIPLGQQELDILATRKRLPGNPWVFPSHGKTGHLVEPKRGWAQLVKRAGIQDLRLHDLRRTLGSFMGDTGASLQIIGKALGHKSQAATLVYSRLSLAPVRDAKDRAVSAMMEAMKQDQAI